MADKATPKMLTPEMESVTALLPDVDALAAVPVAVLLPDLLLLPEPEEVGFALLLDAAELPAAPWVGVTDAIAAKRLWEAKVVQLLEAGIFGV